MARWRLENAHYLSVPGNEWVYEEQSRSSGKAARQRFTVPQYLDPRDGADHNYPGEIIVAHAESKAYPRDIIFVGPPTPDMTPLDEEAEKITEELQPTWQHPIESLPGQYSQSLITAFENQIGELMKSGQAKPVSLSTGSVSEADFKALQEQVAALMAKNAELAAAVEGTPQKQADNARRA